MLSTENLHDLANRASIEVPMRLLYFSPKMIIRLISNRPAYDQGRIKALNLNWKVSLAVTLLFVHQNVPNCIDQYYMDHIIWSIFHVFYYLSYLHSQHWICLWYWASYQYRLEDQAKSTWLPKAFRFLVKPKLPFVGDFHSKQNSSSYHIHNRQVSERSIPRK